MKKTLIASAFLALSSAAMADTYQVSFVWDAPTIWLPSDTPSYGAKYRIAGGAAVILPDSSAPGGGFTYAAPQGALLEICPQNKNGAPDNLKTTPDCSAPEDWVAVGNSPIYLTDPPRPTGFSATIMRVGP